MKETPVRSLDVESIELLRKAVERLEEGFAGLPKTESRSYNSNEVGKILGEAAERLHEELPYFHPLYAGQMLQAPHPIARLAYAMAMWMNPNNHALDSSRASSVMESEAVAEIARMVGCTSHLGHLTSGGTMANLEALWVAGQLTKNSVILASDQAHYTHSRISKVLGLPFETVASDAHGRMDVNALAARLAHGGVGTVVATLGTTATGSVDPLPAIQDLRSKYHFRMHVDAAYGGYFTLAGNLDEHARRSFDLIHTADSFVIDPHKHGLQPYGCGCVVFSDPGIGSLYKHDSPYTYFTSKQLHLGEISLECSRPGSAAVALWATQRLLPLTRNGEFARGLSASRSATLTLHKRMLADERFISPFAPELDILVWTVSAQGCNEASARARQVFDAAAKLGLHLALTELPAGMFAKSNMKMDRPTVTCLRSVLMKAEHLEWEGEIWKRLDKAMNV